jgi:hypothetical protein
MSADFSGVSDAVRKTAIAVGIAFCLLWSQIAGWAVTGQIMADSQVRRDSAALKGELVRGDLRTAAKDLEALAGTPSTGEAQAEIDKLLATYVKSGKGTVGALTDNCAKPDWAPATCRKVADARGMLERAKRRDALKSQIEGGGARIDRTESVAGGAVDAAIPVGILQRLGFVGWDDAAKHAAEADVYFWFVVFFVMGMTFFATFGLAMMGLTHEDLKRGPRELIRRHPAAALPLIILAVEVGTNAIFGWQRANGGLFNPKAWLQAGLFASVGLLGAYLPTLWHGSRKPTDAEKYPELAAWDFGPARIAHAPQALREGEQASAPPAGRSLAVGSDAYGVGYPAAHGQAGFASQPIHVNIGFPPAASLAAGGNDARPVSGPQNAPSAGVPAVAATPAPAGAELLPARDLPDGPIDRSAYEKAKFEQQAVDSLMTFKEACLVAAPGAAVGVEQLYDRYWSWCGGAGLGRREFDQLFPLATGVHQYAIGEVLVWGEVALRDTVQLRRA